MTRILARYLSAIILKHYLLFTALVLLVASLIEFLENRDGLMERPALTLGDIVAFSVLSAPGIFSLLSGFIALVSVLVAGITLLRHSELKAILAAGLSYGQLLLALLPAALVMAGFHFWMENVALPRATAELRDWGVGQIQNKPADTNAIWVRQDHYILAAAGLREQTRSLTGVDLFALDKSGRLLWHMAAPAARFTRHGLHFQGAIKNTPGNSRGNALNDVDFDIPLDFDIIAALSLNPRHTSAWRIARVINQTSAVSHPRYVYRLWFHRKLAGPLTTALAVLLLAPLAQYVHRIGSVRLLLVGLAVGFIGFVADAILTGLAEAGTTDPVASAWALPALLLLVIVPPLFTGQVPRTHSPS